MKTRFLFFYFILIFSFGFLFSRLFYLTVIKGEENRLISEEQRIRLRRLPAPRGIIFDRRGVALVENVPVYKKCDVEFSCKEISRQEALALEAKGHEAELFVGIGRDYPHGEALSHVLGYLSEATPEEVEKGERKLAELVGRTGIEEKYDFWLQGTDGGELLETDVKGKTLRRVGRKEPVLGKDLILTIDLGLQKKAFEELSGRKGAVVAQNAKTGEVLALVSSPSFSPGYINEALKNPERPMFNRAIAGIYPPGSTFKIVTAAAGLEEGKITKETEIEDKGEIRIGTYRFANWYFTQYGKTEGMVDLVKALKRSTDTFFYKVGEFVGASKLLEWAKTFGLGRKTGIDLPGETPGFLPDPEKGDWFLGNTYHLAIGQGDLGLTPLQVNQMTLVIASGGKLCQPYLVKEIPTGTDKVTLCQEVGLKKETIKLITEGMREACMPGGTAFPFFDFEVQVACKTGTAEFGDPKGRTHAWFTAFAPLSDPEIVITALVEGGGEGSKAAAPIVKELLQYWFSQ